MKLTHGSLFSGRGGFDIAAEICGIENIYNCEHVEWLRHKLKRISPNAKQDNDVRNLHPVYTDIITAGFPCQDISISNKNNKKGIKGSRSGLWFEVQRIIAELKPLYVILENSSQLHKQGLEYILSGLSEIGYDAEWDCFQATDFGYPHQRQRMYIIAYPCSNRCRTGILKPPSAFELSRKWIPTTAYLSVSAGRINRFRDVGVIQRGNVVHNFRREIHAFGNAVMPVIAEHLFNCIITNYQLLTTN